LFVGENLEQPAALLLLNINGLVELRWQKEAVLDQDISDAFPERFTSHRAYPCGPSR
jgi:hypothetical protein